MSFLDMLDLLAGRAVDATFGQTVEYFPRILGRHTVATSADPSRPHRTITAAFHLAPEDARPFEDRRAGTTALGDTSVPVGGCWLQISAETATAMGYELRTGDLVVVPGLPEPNRFTVTKPDMNDLGAYVLALVRETT